VDTSFQILGDFFVFVFEGTGLNSGLHACKAAIPPVHFALVILVMGVS
jgi:hypothetical protein